MSAYAWVVGVLEETGIVYYSERVEGGLALK